MERALLYTDTSDFCIKPSRWQWKIPKRQTYQICRPCPKFVQVKDRLTIRGTALFTSSEFLEKSPTIMRHGSDKFMTHWHLLLPSFSSCEAFDREIVGARWNSWDYQLHLGHTNGDTEACQWSNYNIFVLTSTGAPRNSLMMHVAHTCGRC